MNKEKSNSMSPEDKKLYKRMRELRLLLKEFDAILYGYDPGISWYVKNGKEVDLRTLKMKDKLAFNQINDAGLKWLEPLLKELRAYRKYKTSRGIDG